MKTRKMFIGVDQFGNTFHGLEHPRKDLMERLGVNHAEKMYVTEINGGTFHVGYVIGQHWINVYEVKPMRKAA